MPLIFGAFQDMTETEKENIAFLYEYYDKAESRSVNGYPIFMSVRAFMKDQFDELATLIDKYQALKKEFLKPDENENIAGTV